MQKRCPQCEQVKDETVFYVSTRKKDGRDVYCKECRDGRTRVRVLRIRAERPVPVPPTEKECTRCKVVKPLSEFYSRKDRGGLGKESRCKQCKDELHAEYITRPEVAAKLREQSKNRASKTWKRPPRREPVGEGFEVCTMCNLDKPLDEFHVHKLGRNGRDSMCRDCKRVLARERNKHPDVQEREYRNKVVRVYGLSHEAYDALLESQGGVCAICKRPPNGKRLHVDHDHACCNPGRGRTESDYRTCGKCNRGLLCYTCNGGLGNFGDDPDRLVRAAQYLRGQSMFTPEEPEPQPEPEPEPASGERVSSVEVED